MNPLPYDPVFCGEVSGTYGSGQTPCTVFTYEADGGTWYAVQGSLNVNFTGEPVEEGVDVETLADSDMFTASRAVDTVEILALEVCA